MDLWDFEDRLKDLDEDIENVNKALSVAEKYKSSTDKDRARLGRKLYRERRYELESLITKRYLLVALFTYSKEKDNKNENR